MKVRLIAVDPGAVSGAYALFYDDGLPFVGDLPVVNGQVDAATFGRLVFHASPHDAVVTSAEVTAISATGEKKAPFPGPS